ncbi:MAG: lipid-A-disaccharide synthase [Gallionellaceae bacterium]|nr:lipid-A-disaccharide synthase [Gallionellaceae bacterium]
MTSDQGTSIGSSRPSVGIVAGEASGDLLGSLLIKSLREQHDELDFQGIAGAKMQAQGARSLFPMETLSVRGYVEALASLRKILAIRRRLAGQLLKQRPRLFIGIDAPDFNLALETRLKRAGIPTVHFISPSIWAWRKERIHKIRKAVSHMLLIFPFEDAIYRDAGIPATYVGHPLAYALPAQPDRKASREKLGLNPEATYLALLPGSRQSEVQQLAVLFLETAKRLHAENPALRFLVPLATQETRRLFEDAIHSQGAAELPIRILFGHSHDALQAADAAIVASGTATLEAALLGCPHVITYRVPWLTYKLMMSRAYLPWVGLPNILANRDVVPELIQDQAKPELLAAAIDRLLNDADARATMLDAFTGIRNSLRRDTPRLINTALEPFLR